MKSLLSKYHWLYVAVVCCVLLVACEPGDEPTNGNAITFKNGQKRASIADDDANARLFAYRTTANGSEWLYGEANKGVNASLTNIVFENSKANLTIGDNRSIPWTNARYNFFAIYSPTFGTFTNNEPQFTDGSFCFPYSIPGNGTGTNLELWSAHIFNEWHLATETNPVVLEFNHILSKINFNVKKHSENSEDTIKVTKISIGKIYTSGVYTLSATDETWIFRTAEDATIKDTTTTLVFSSFDNPSIEVVGTDVLPNGFLVIPQTIRANTIDVVINYTYKAEGDTDTEEKTATAKLPASTSWLVGKNYVYNLLLSATTNNIYFSTPTISDWGQTQATGTIIIK